MTVRVGYHASHEQYPPSRLLSLVRRAEGAGFECGMCSDHFHPWSRAQGESGFAWSWLGAALQATRMTLGVVTVPGGWRYHPAVLAQAAATLAEMFPGRFWLAPGSGENLNEHVVGEGWPGKEERQARLREGVEIMRALWRGETVTHHGHVTVEDARLYSLPAEPPRVVGAALSPETARWMGGWADGLVTVVGEREQMRRIVEAFREGGGEGKPLYLQAQLSWAPTYAEAVRAAHEQWRMVQLPSALLADLASPGDFEAASRHLDPEEISRLVRCSADPEEHLEWLARDAELGFEEINLHCVGREMQERFIDLFGDHVVPELRAR